MVIDTGVFIEHLRAKDKLHTTLFVPAGSLEKDPALDAYMKHKHPMPGRLRQILLGRQPKFIYRLSPDQVSTLD